MYIKQCNLQNTGFLKYGSRCRPGLLGIPPKIHSYMDSFKNPIGGMDFEPVQNWSRFLQPAYKIKLVI